MALVVATAACAPARQTTPVAPPQPTVPPPAATPARTGPPKVVLLVPLSGRSAAIGRDLVDAAQMALFDVGENDLVLLPRDTGDKPEAAVAAFRAAVAEGAGLALGPLFSASTRELAPAAAETGVPVLSFSNDASVAGGRVFVLGFRPEEQVERVVRFGYERGMRRIGFLGPDDAYAALALRAFEATAGRLGAAGPSALYGPRNDPAAAIATVTKADAAPPPDGLLIAEGGERLTQVAAILQAGRVDALPPRLLGTSRWIDGKATLRDPALAGAWVAAVPPAFPEAFARRFAATFGRNPHALAALAYDATAFAVLLARSDRSFALDIITDPQGYVGTLGPFRLRLDGTTEHRLAILEIGAGGATVLDPVREGFTDLRASN